jgi:hypothetical protein
VSKSEHSSVPEVRRKPKEGHREEKGGHHNLIREAEEETMRDLLEIIDTLKDLEE